MKVKVLNLYQTDVDRILWTAARTCYSKKSPIELYIDSLTTKNEDMEELINELKQQIIAALNLEDMTPDDIDADAPLFGEGLGLDSIDALELIVLMEKQYGIRLATPAEGKAIFKSVRTMADYVSKNRKK